MTSDISQDRDDGVSVTQAVEAVLRKHSNELYWSLEHGRDFEPALLDDLAAFATPAQPKSAPGVEGALALVRRIAARESWQSHYGKRWEDEAAEIIAALSAPTAPAQSDDAVIREACKPWEYHTGEPPEWDSPLSAVYDAGIGYAYERLAELLDVADYQGGDGSEDYATDVMNTGRNILVAAGYVDADGDLLKPAALKAAQSDDRVKALEEALREIGNTAMAVSGKSAGEVEAYYRGIARQALAPVHTPDTAQGGGEER